MKDDLPKNILVVDPDISVAETIVALLRRFDVRVERAADLDSAAYLFENTEFDAVLIDADLKPLDGLTMVQKWRLHKNARRRWVGFVLMDSSPTRAPARSNLIRELGDITELEKPVREKALMASLVSAKQARAHAERLDELRFKILSYKQKGGGAGGGTEFRDIAEALKRSTLGLTGDRLLLELYESAGQLDEALELVASAMEKYPSNLSLVNTRARLLLTQGKNADARYFFEQADRSTPGHIERIRLMITNYLKLNDDKATVKMKEFLSKYPENGEMKFDLLAKLFEKGMNKEAVEFGRDVADPAEIVRYYNNRGVLAAREGNYKQAKLDYERALGFYPSFEENYKIHFNTALALMHERLRSSWELARTNVQKSIKLKSTFDKAHRILAIIEKQLGSRPAAASLSWANGARMSATDDPDVFELIQEIDSLAGGDTI